MQTGLGLRKAPRGGSGTDLGLIWAAEKIGRRAALSAASREGLLAGEVACAEGIWRAINVGKIAFDCPVYSYRFL